MRSTAFAAAMVLAAAPAAAQDFGHLASLVQPPGQPLGEVSFADADGDGDQDLYLAVLRDDGSRALVVHYQHQSLIFSTGPDLEIELPPAVVAWEVGDYLDGEGAEGAEVLMLASRGVYVRTSSGRPQAIDTTPLLLDMPSGQALPRWRGQADIDGDGRPELALATATGYRIIDTDGTLLGEVQLKPTIDRAPTAAGSFLGGVVRPKLGSQEMSDLFVPNEALGVIARPPALYTYEALPAPVWVDADGDGRLDLSYLFESELRVHLQASDGSFPPEADRRFELDQDKADESDDIAQLEWVDVGGGPAADLLEVRQNDEVLGSSGDWKVRLHVDPAVGPGFGDPDAFFKLDANYLWVYIKDLDGDGGGDLCVSAWDLDFSLLGAVAPEVDHRMLAFPSSGPGNWTSRPSFSITRSYALEDLDSLVSLDSFSMDLTGDGRPDLLERSRQGDLEVRSFVRGSAGVGVGDAVVARVPLDALLGSVRVEDINGDGVGDFLIRRDGRFEVHLSFRRAQ